MTPEEIETIREAALACDPGAEVSWDCVFGTLTITCVSECAAEMQGVIRTWLPVEVLLIVLRRAV